MSATSQGVLSQDAKLTAGEAIELADRYVRYALDRLASDIRAYHPGVRSHLTAMATQSAAVVELSQPQHDGDWPQS